MTTETGGSLQDLVDRLAEEIVKEDGPEALAALDAGSNHPYNCRCATCLTWWAHMGPDGGDAGDYGPFTKDEVNGEQRRLGIEVTP